MKNSYRIWLAPAAVIVMAACNQTPKKTTTYVFRDIGWTMTLPAQFKVVDSAGVKKLNENGKQLMEQSAGQKLDISSTRTLISAKKGNQYFTATITPFDTAKDGNYAAANQTVKELLFRTFTTQMPDAKLDSGSEMTKVGGLEFDRYRLSVSIKGDPVFTVFLVSRLYKGYEFAMSYLYTDQVSKAQMESILASSKFE